MGSNAKSVSIIGGADGPTSVFIAGRQSKPKLSQRIKNHFYKKKRLKTEKKIVANPHTIDEVIRYITDKYSAVEVSAEEYSYIEERKGLKESLIIRNKPELLGDLMEIKRPKEMTKDTMKMFFEEIQKRSQRAEQIPDEEFPMDFHIYEIKYAFGQVRISIEKNWNEFGISSSGDKKNMKKLKAIAKDIYLYYGVTGEDIDNRTSRYSVLVTMLSS